MLRSFLDLADRHRVAGWAQDDVQPNAPLSLLILANDALVARVLANRYRADLEAAGIGNGRHGFQFDFLHPLPPGERHVIRVCREADGTELDRSPVELGPRQPPAVGAQQLLASLLEGDLSDAELVRSIDLMVENVDKALQQLADRHSSRAERREYRHFLERWRRRVWAGNAPLSVPKERAPALRALVIDDRVPKPDRDAGSVAILSHIRSLQRLGFEVTFVAALEFAGDAADDAILDAIGVRCCRAPYYASIEEVLHRQAGEFDLVYLHRVANAAKYRDLVCHHFPKARQIYSVADLHHLRLARQAATEDRPELTGVAQRLRLLEFAAAALADAVITHSSDEANLLRANVAGANVYTVRWSVASRPTTVPFKQRHGIAFIGGYSHPPNLDAARWLIAEIMPLVRKYDPTIECLLVGDGLPDVLLQRCGDGVVAVGRVEDLAAIFDRVRLTVAPLGYGAGIKGKVIESLAAGLPCVCTAIAAEGLDLPEALQGCVAATAEEIAAAVCRLHSDEKANQASRTAGLRYIAAAFSQQQLDTQMRRVVGEHV
jgi:glycosyltransferase involved in cell wall biosynthesis